MAWRFFRFFLFQLCGASFGYWFHGPLERTQGALAGVLVASTVWVIWDLQRAHRVMRWLRDESPFERFENSFHQFCRFVS